MLQMAAAFGGGLIARNTFDGVQLPHLRCNNGVPAFKLSVRFVAASVPSITAPGLISQRRPFVDVSLGSSRKETELADFDAECCSCEEEDAPQCPWRFGDALTFKPSMEDVMGPGLQLTLRVRQDVGLGPLQLDLGEEVVGTATVDLHRRALPACIGSTNSHKNEDLTLGASSSGTWMSPLMLVPLAPVCDSGTREERPLTERAMLAVFFAVDVDPEAVLETVETRAQMLDGLGQAARKLGEACGGLARWFDEAADRGEGMCAALKLAAPARLCHGEEDDAEEDSASTCMPHSAESSQASPDSPRTLPETRSVEVRTAARQHTHHTATYPPAEVDAFRVSSLPHNVEVVVGSPCVMQGIAKVATATLASRGAGAANVAAAAVATGLPVEAAVRPPLPAPDMPQQSAHSRPFQLQPPCAAWSTSQSRASQLLHVGVLDLGRPRNNAVPDLGQPRALPAVSAPPTDASLSPLPPLSPTRPDGQTGGPALGPSNVAAQRPIIPEEVAC